MKYIGKKLIDAVSMSKHDAEDVLGRKLGSQHSEEEENEAGYLVTYEDGYKSWSPAVVFEKAYKKADTFLDRLRIERDELLERIRKANAYIYSDEGMAMDDNDRNCLKRQANIMDSLLDILNIRIYNAEADERAKADLARKAAEKTNQAQKKN